MYAAASVRSRALLALSIALTAAATATAAETDRWAAGRQLFTTAYAAAESGAPESHEGDSKALREYPLYPYLQRARIARQLDGAADAWGPGDDAARKFLRRHAAEPVADDLSALWLHSLARRRLWSAFVQHYDAAAADTALACEWLQAQIALDDTAELAPIVAARWLTAERLPPECEPPFEWLRNEGQLSDAMTAQRARMLLENGQTGFARVVVRRLPAALAAPLVQWADLLERPKATIDALLADRDLLRRTPSAALQAGWSKLARDDPSAALQRFEPLFAAIEPNARDRSRYSLALAFGLAWDRRAEDALDAFESVDASDLDD